MPAMAERSLPLGSDFNIRFKNDAERKAEKRRKSQEAETYPASAGLYTLPFTASLQTANRGEFSLTDPLAGVEQAIDAQIDRLLELKDERPSILVDFGGSMGVSFIRIAAKRRALIEEGRLAMFVTNLAFAPDFNLEDATGYRGIARLLNTDTRYDYYHHKVYPPYYSTEELDFINRNQSLVCYVRGDVRELAMQGMKVNGQVTSWQNNVDLIHEQKVLIHSSISDYMLPRLGSWLSNTGVLLVGSNENLFQGGSKNVEEVYKRKRAYRRGMNNLSQMRHISRRDIPKSTYAIFEKQSTPNILDKAA